MKKNKLTTRMLLTVLALLGIVVWAFFLRIGAFPNHPASLYIDEIAMLVDAKALVTTGHDMHGNSWLQSLYPSYGDYKMPVYLWAVYLASLLFTPSAFSVRLPSLMAGFGTFVIVYALLRTLYTNKTPKHDTFRISAIGAGIATVVTLGFSPWAIQFSRTGFEAYLGQFILGLAVLVLLRSKKRFQMLVLAMGLAALATYTYFSVRYVWIPIYLVWMVSQSNFITDPKAWMRVKNNIFLGLKLGLYLLVFLILLLPLFKSALYEASMQFRLSTPSILQNHEQVVQANEYRTIAGDSLLDRVLFHRIYFTGQVLAHNLSEQLSPRFIFITGDTNLRHGTGKYGLFLFPFMLPFCLGLYVLARKRKWMLAILITWIVSAALPAAVPLTVPHALRFLNALIPFSVIISVGIYEGFTLFWNTKTHRTVKRSLVGLFGLIAVFYAAAFSCYYFSVYPKVSDDAWFRSQSELATAVSSYISPEQSLTLLGTPDKFYLWLLAYGPYSGTEFANWSTEQYQFSEMDNVSFKVSEKYVDQQHLLLPSEEYSEHFDETNSIQSRVTQEITLSNGKRFTLLTVQTTD